jgi:hydroxymethylpyrimidine pyrophosphatase-like HAD family hydrolase
MQKQREESSGLLSVAEAPVQERMLDTEYDFYKDYRWSLSPLLTVGDAIGRLSKELDRVGKVPGKWQAPEVETNVFLLSCALLNAIDDYLCSSRMRLPAILASVVPFARQGFSGIEKLVATARRRRVRRVWQWREHLQAKLDAFLQVSATGGALEPTAVAAAAKELKSLLQHQPAPKLRARPTNINSGFRKQDLTPRDVLALGTQFVTRFPDRQRPLLVIGLRTAGSFFAPLLRAFLRSQGYQAVDIVTVRPSEGFGDSERERLTECARRGDTAVIIDDPPETGDTIAVAIDLIRQTGFPAGRLVVLFPIRPLRREWTNAGEDNRFSGVSTLFLEPEQWHKYQLLEPRAVEVRLTEYLRKEKYSSIRVVSSPIADRYNTQMAHCSVDPNRARLKRVYEVRLEIPDGGTETRYVLAKSVGWGWLGYHAFLAGRLLARFTPPVLGLRDGILYTEWIPQPENAAISAADRKIWIQTAASYSAARVRSLRLSQTSAANSHLIGRCEGFELLDRVLGKAYGDGFIASLMRGRLRDRLSKEPCSVPTLIDGKMHRSEWISSHPAILKTDFEHHGMGKNEVNVVDPAYDLAEAILQLDLSTEEEALLICRYIEESDDTDVQRRLYLHKLLAGTWAMASALKLLKGSKGADRQKEANQQFLNAWNFLTTQTAKFCGGLCQPPKSLSWRSPLIVLDIDGVLDRRIFGFPCTTAAGIRAISLLHAHDFPIAINTARYSAEVRHYCEAYGFVGAVAEYGSYIWDAVGKRDRVLVTPESLTQLERISQALEQLPGVFLNDAYRYSIRANTFANGSPVPLPLPMIQQLMASLKLDRLCFHQTGIDTTILAREVDKGRGLSALLDWVGQPQLETVAVGDSDPDLPMFAAASRSFAPANTSFDRIAAHSIGCQIDRHPYQQGLLSIVRSLVHPERGSCRLCRACERPLTKDHSVFIEALEAADRGRRGKFLRALLHPNALRVFRQSR